MQNPSNALPRDILITVGSGKSTTSSFSSTPKKKASSSAVTTATAAPKPVERPSVASRLFWKRAKTDLGADSLANYKANRASATSVQGKQHIHENVFHHYKIVKPRYLIRKYYGSIWKYTYISRFCLTFGLKLKREEKLSPNLVPKTNCDL